MGPGEWIKFFNENPGATVAVAEAGALIYLFRELMRAKSETLELTRAVLPVAETLGNGVQALERMSGHDHKD